MDVDQNDLPMISYGGTVTTADDVLLLGLTTDGFNQTWYCMRYHPRHHVKVRAVFIALEAIEWVSGTQARAIESLLRSLIVGTIATGRWTCG